MLSGHGSLELGLWADPEAAGGRAEYLHRLSESWALGARGDVYREWAGDWGWSAEALVRGKW